MNLFINGGVYLNSGGGDVIHTLFAEYGPEIIRFKLFTNVVKNHIQSVRHFSFSKRDLFFLGLYVLLLGNEVHFLHGGKDIILARFCQLPCRFFFGLGLLGERVVSERSFYGAGNKGGFNQIEIFGLLIKEVLGRYSETSAKTRHKELVHIHLKDLFLCISVLQESRLN